MNPFFQSLAQRFQQARMGHHHGGMRDGMHPGFGGGGPPMWGQIGGGWGGGMQQQMPQQNQVGPMPRPMMPNAMQPQAAAAQQQPQGLNISNGWLQRMAAGGTPGPNGEMPTEQVKMGAQNDDDEDDRQGGY